VQKLVAKERGKDSKTNRDTMTPFVDMIISLVTGVTLTTITNLLWHSPRPLFMTIPLHQVSEMAAALNQLQREVQTEVVSPLQRAVVRIFFDPSARHRCIHTIPPPLLSSPATAPGPN
jgi:hypothetical protein